MDKFPPEIVAEIYFDDGKRAGWYALGKEGFIYKPRNLWALVNPFGEKARFSLFCNEMSGIEYILSNCLLEYSDIRKKVENG